MNVLNSINQKIDELKASISPQKQDASTEEEITNLKGQVETLQTEKATLDANNAVLSEELETLKAENISLKEANEKSEGDASTAAAELKEANAVIADPKGTIQKSVAEHVKNVLAESGHDPNEEADVKHDKEAKSELHGLARVRAAWKQGN